MSAETVLTLILLLTSSLDCANILMIHPSMLHSHHIAFLDVWKELHHRGHNITFATPFAGDESIANFTRIDTSLVSILMETKYTPAEIGARSPWSVWTIYWDLVADSQDMIMPLPEMQDIIQNPGKYNFDVVITELWHTNFFAISRLYKCPSIAYATIDMYEALHWHLGNQINYITVPDLNLGIFEATNFYERLISAVYTVHEMFKEYFFYMPQQQAILDKYFENVPVKELKQDIDLMLVNANPFLKGVRALGPTTVMVGGGNHLSPPQPIPQDLETYLDAAEEGFIYMSLGSNLKSTDLEEHVLGVLIEVMGKLPYKILWKFEAETLPQKMDNVKIVQWAPQQDVLRHPNIKLFISQGGVQSLEEAVFSGVPVLIMPFFGDQYKNGQLAVSKGFGKMILHRPRLNKYELESSILELINNQKYKNTAIRLAKLMNDTYMTGLEKSVWWIEYVIRNNGTKELRNPAAKLPFYQYYALDVLGFIFSIAIVMVLVLRRIVMVLLVVTRRVIGRKLKKL